MFWDDLPWYLQFYGTSHGTWTHVIIKLNIIFLISGHMHWISNFILKFTWKPQMSYREQETFPEYGYV